MSRLMRWKKQPADEWFGYDNDIDDIRTHFCIIHNRNQERQNHMDRIYCVCQYRLGSWRRSYAWLERSALQQYKQLCSFVEIKSLDVLIE